MPDMVVSASSRSALRDACAAAQLVDLFGSTRDAWIQEDLQGWLAPNRIYDGVPAVLNHLLQQAEVYIVTTKQVGCYPAC